MFVYSLEDRDPYSTHNVKGGTFQNVHKEDFPALQGMAFHRLSMEPGTLNPPHWHTNAHEIVYVISGTGLFGIRGPSDADSDVFKATAGDVVFIEQNYSHWFKSIGSDNLDVAVWFNAENPTTLGLVSSLRGVPDSEVGLAYGVAQDVVTGLNTDVANLLAGQVSAEEVDGFNDPSDFKTSMFDDDKLDFEDSAAGTIRKVKTENFAKMQDFLLAHITVQPGAMRQIHWHLFPNELNLVLSGKGEFGVVTPDNTSYVYPVGRNDVIMAPVGYSHYALNSGNTTFEFLLGFDHANIDGVDVRQVLGNMCPDSVRQQTLKIDGGRIDQLRTASVPIVPPL